MRLSQSSWDSVEDADGRKAVWSGTAMQSGVVAYTAVAGTVDAASSETAVGTATPIDDGLAH